MRKILFALLLAPLFFTACKKSEDTPNEFIINGIHDVDMGAALGNTLGLTVSVSSGVQEVVNLSASGLPAGISVAFTPASGTPAFGTVATFSGFAAAGTYPIKITGTSASYTKSYDLNLTVPALNGWRVDGVSYSKGFVNKSNVSGYGVISATSTSGSEQLTFFKMSSFPTADGTYTFTAGDPFTSSTAVGIDFIDGSRNTYSTESGNTTVLTLVISNGKIRATLPPTTLSDGASTTKTIVVDLAE